MKKFLINILIFLLPILIILLIPVFILIISKENFFKIDKVINSKEKYFIGYVYNEVNYHYLKWAYLNLNDKKDIWALGSSRVLLFRENMFDLTFYNAGYTILGLNDFKSFLNSIPKSKYPKYLIIGLDQWMFNEKFDDLNKKNSINSWKNSFTFFPKPATYLSVYKDLFTNKYGFSALLQDDGLNRIGLNAKINNTGFVNDGSIYYGKQIVKLINNDVTANDYKYRDTYDRIENGGWLFERGDSVNNKALLELDKLLKFCKENQIQVVAFFPPFADEVYKKMIETGGYGYLQKIYDKTKPIFDKYEYEIYNFSTVSSCDSSDKETIDGFHGGELTYQRILIKMLNSGSILNKVTNINRLKKDLLKSKNNYLIYDN